VADAVGVGLSRLWIAHVQPTLPAWRKLFGPTDIVASRGTHPDESAEIELEFDDGYPTQRSTGG
jgi:hypothetical protein